MVSPNKFELNLQNINQESNQNEQKQNNSNQF